MEVARGRGRPLVLLGTSPGLTGLGWDATLKARHASWTRRFPDSAPGSASTGPDEIHDFHRERKPRARSRVRRRRPQHHRRVGDLGSGDGAGVARGRRRGDLRAQGPGAHGPAGRPRWSGCPGVTVAPAPRGRHRVADGRGRRRSCSPSWTPPSRTTWSSCAGRRLAVRLTGDAARRPAVDLPHRRAAEHRRDGRSEGVRGELAAVAKASRFLLCQTEELRCFLEGVLHKAAGKCVLFPPVVALPRRAGARGGPHARPAAAARLHGQVRAALEHLRDDRAAPARWRRAASTPSCT